MQETVFAIDPHDGVGSYCALYINERGEIEEREISVNTRTLFDCIGFHSPNIVLIEGQYVGINKAVAIKLAVAAGKAAGMCDILEIPYKLISPLEWNRHMGFIGKKEEEQIKIRGEIAEHIRSINEHLVDCYCIYLCYKNITPEEWRKTHA